MFTELFSWIRKQPKPEARAMLKAEREMRDKLDELEQTVKKREQISEKLSCAYNKQIEEASSVMAVHKGLMKMLNDKKKDNGGS